MREFVSIVLGIPQENITVISRSCGGGFGGKAYVWPHNADGSPGRPISAPSCANSTDPCTDVAPWWVTSRRPFRRFTLAADKTGKLTGIRHDSISPTSVFDNYIEYAANASRSLWSASGGIATQATGSFM